MKRVAFKSPTRVDLAGGTLDLWPLHAIMGGATTINLAIEVFTYCELIENSGTAIEVELTDIGVKRSYANLVELLNDGASDVALVRVMAEHFKPTKGFRIQTRSESPVGGGLGGSSSLCISMIRTFQTWLGIESTPNQTVELAHNIEARVLGLATGTQDYVPALLGGLCMIDYGLAGMDIQRVEFDLAPFQRHGFLAYTGRPHHSGLNNWDVFKKFIEKEPATVEALRGIRKKAERLKQAVASRRVFEDETLLKQLFRESYLLRTQLSPMFTSPEIEKLQDVALKAGADAVKILGAGGGGCVLVWSQAGRRQGVLEACQSAGFKVMDVKASSLGARPN